MMSFCLICLVKTEEIELCQHGEETKKLDVNVKSTEKIKGESEQHNKYIFRRKIKKRGDADNQATPKRHEIGSSKETSFLYT